MFSPQACHFVAIGHGLSGQPRRITMSNQFTQQAQKACSQVRQNPPNHILKNKNINRMSLSKHQRYTIFPTPGDPTNIILSTDDTRAWPVSAKLKTNKKNRVQVSNVHLACKLQKAAFIIPSYYVHQILRSTNS